jgi:dipeptidyl aminopeptidase/acylaminoacyl peptidase
MGTFRYSLLLACVSLLAQPGPEDLFTLKTIGEVQVSPDGSTILFTLTETDLKNNRNIERLMMLRGSDVHAVPGAPEGATTPRWSRDGARFAYVAQKAIWVQATGDKTPKKICAYDRGNSFLSKSGNTLVWSPDGKQIAFAGTIEPAPPAQDPIVVTRIQYKTRTSISDNRRSHIYVVSSNGGDPHPLTSGNYDEHSIDWGGDGKEIIFLSNHEKDPDARLNYDIFAVNTTSGKIRQITYTPGVEYDPKVSPDGRLIAYTATRRPITTIDSVAEDTHIWVVPLGGGDGRELNAALDRRSNSPEWTPDNQGILYTAADHGKNVLYRVPASGGKSEALVDRKAQVAGVSVSKTIAFTMSDPATPAELYSLKGSEPLQLTHLNSVKGWRLSAPETIAFPSFDKTSVEGWFYPATKTAGSKQPLILSIHGGPHGQFGYGFNPAFQLYAARGYATLAINPRGSSGYGQKFADGTLNNWGGGDYKDLMAGVDHVLKTHPEIDENRLGVTGGSYGGYMTNWVITQTNRFKAAVAAASVSDLISFYATSLYQDLVHAEFNGFPWANGNFATLWKWSPLAHIANASTPALFLHGEQDNDVHITQAEEMYTALREHGIEAELVRYPREGHGFREPKHIQDSRLRTLDWMDKHVR